MMYAAVKVIPDSIPAIAPSRFMVRVKVPRMITGKNDDAASPKAKATVCATNPGGLMPSSPATVTAKKALTRAAMSSPRSEMSGRSARFSRSWLIADEITSSSPAAVESAAASPPAATSPTTQFGSREISGLASTMMSRSMVSSFSSGSATYWMLPSPLRSSKEISPVPSHLLNHSGMASYGWPATVSSRLARAKTATAGAVV